jgi:hypothetical protein
MFDFLPATFLAKLGSRSKAIQRPAQPSSDLKFEIGHVLFIDVVGYSRLLINEQSELIREVKEIVREGRLRYTGYNI